MTTDELQRYLSRKQSRHPRTATRIQLAGAAGRGDFSSFPRDQATLKAAHTPVDSPSGTRGRRCVDVPGSGGLLRSGGKLRRRRSLLLAFFFFSSCRMKELPHRLPLRQVGPVSEETPGRQKQRFSGQNAALQNKCVVDEPFWRSLF